MDERTKLLVNYLHEEFNVKREKISLSSSLLYDFEWSGDDIDEFFQRIIKDFGIHVIDLNLKRFYVGDEPFDFVGPTIRLIKNEKIENKPIILISDILLFIGTGILN